MEKTLVFFTSNFPYGTGETFIESEFPFLISAFDKIIIISNAQETKTKRITPQSNVKIFYFPYHLTFLEKINSLRGILSNVFWEEIKLIKLQYKLSVKWSMVKTLLTSIQKKKKIADYVSWHIKNINTNDIWLYSYWLNDMAIGIAELKIRMPYLKTFSRAHGWDVYMERHGDQYLPLRNFVLKNMDTCYAISYHGKLYLDKLSNHHYSQKIKLARLGTVNKNEIKLLNSQEPLHLVSCSSLISLKRIHLIIEALHLLTIPIKWTHIGSGQLERELEELAQLKLADKSNITYCFIGQLRNIEVLNFYNSQRVDVFINVSETEGVPVSIMEVMSFGIPVIATNVGGNSEIVNLTNGYLLSHTPTINEVKEAIVFFEKISKETFLKYKENARKTWEENYNAAINYPDFIADSLRL